jgi:DHA1 family multidrug resistance protein-like MFS transporter
VKYVVIDMLEQLRILKNADFRTACIAAFVLEFSAMTVIPIIPLYSKTLGATATLIGSMFAGYAAGRMVSLIPGGYLSDRKGDATVAGIATLCSALPPYLITLTANPEYFVLLRTVEGFFLGMVGPALYSIINRSIKSEQRGFSIGIYIFFALSGSALAPLLGGYLATSFSMKYPFYVSAILSASAGILVFLSVTKPQIKPPEPDSKGLSFMHDFAPFIKTTKGLFLVGIAVISFYSEFIWGMVQAVIPLFIQDILHAGVQNVALVFTFNFTILLVSQPFMGYLADRFGGAKMLTFIGTALMLCVLSLGIGQTFWQFLAFYSIECLVAAAVLPITRKMVGDMYSDTQLTGKAFGIFLTLSSVGSVVGPIVCSAFYQVYPSRLIFVVAGTVGLLCLTGYVLLLRFSRPRD